MRDRDDERPHSDVEVERWWFEFIDEAHDLAGHVEFTWWPAVSRARYIASVIGAGRPQVVVIDDEIPARTLTQSLEFRHHEIWAQHVCETPFDHWTVGLEAYGVLIDDPVDAVTRPWGERVGLGFDVEWEASGPPEGPADRYAHPCLVTGEVLVGANAFDVYASGWRGHEWTLPVAEARWADGTRTDGDGVEVVAEASAGGDTPAPWQHRRFLVRSGDMLGWLDRGAENR